MKVICALRSARRQSLVHYLAALGEPHALHDLIVIRQHDPLCLLVPEGGEEVVEVAGVKGGRVGGEAAGHIAVADDLDAVTLDRKSTRLNSSHSCASRMPSSS